MSGFFYQDFKWKGEREVIQMSAYQVLKVEWHVQKSEEPPE